MDNIKSGGTEPTWGRDGNLKLAWKWKWMGWAWDSLLTLLATGRIKEWLDKAGVGGIRELLSLEVSPGCTHPSPERPDG